MPKQLSLMRILLLITFSLFSVISFSQLDETSPWVWMKGDNIYNAGGAYGTLGVGSPTNKPGNRIDAVNWHGNDGKMYFFGGSSIINSSTFFHNDFWQYDPGSNVWTWIGGATAVDQFGTYGTIGVASASNIPGSRSHAMSWKDNQGNFWLFGGHGYSSNSVGYLNDLWKYNPTTRSWTWIKGNNSSGGDPNAYGTLGIESPGNQPASRYEATTWTDVNGNLWMFGGYNYPSHGLLNDLWKFNTVTNNWVCFKVSQQNAGGQPQVRSGAKGWADKSGNIWLFGGLGYNNIYMSDVWKYTISTNQWTYIRGSSSASLIGSYGYKGVPSSSNTPGGRSLFATWTDQNGLFWLFGGGGLATSVSATGYLNDLWSYDPVANIWTWIKGDNSLNQGGVYGTQTIANVNNKPGSRWRSVGWIDGTGNLWLFGGLGSDAPGSNGQFNDLWKLEKACPSLPLSTPSIISSDSIICSGNGIWLNTAKLQGVQYVWLKDGVVVPSSDTSCWASTPGIYSVKIYSVCSNDSAVSRGMQVTVLSSSVKPVITANGSLNFCNGTATLTSSATTNNQWYKDNVAISGATNQSYVVSAAGAYKVVHSNACGSSTSDPVAITAATTPAVTFTLVNSSTDLNIQPLKDGDSINLATLSSTNLNIRANSDSPIGSMVFNLTGAQTVNQTESVSPYALFQDISGDYFDWTPAVGNYTLKATPFCEAGGTGTAGTTATINFKVINKAATTNQLPTVNLYAYPVGSGIAPGTIALNVNAQDPDGTIAKIEIYQNGVLVFETQQSFANFGVTGLSSGGYMYQAKAIDNRGGVTLSQLIPLFIYEPLSIGLIAPASGSNFTAPATINLEATASGGDGTFSKVEFYNGTTKLGEDLAAPYTFNWTNVAAGTYSLTAKVFHNMGDNATSSAVTITVNEPINQPPTISLTAPVNGASLPAPATVTLTAVASDADGSITKVEFYNGASKIGEDITAPYQYEWSSVGAGNYSLTAKAIDNRGGISTSTAVSITILNPVNQLPTVSLNTPIVTYGPTNADPVTIFIQATASDADGFIAKVELYQNGMLVGVATTPPYHFFAVIMNSGPYTFTARAYDNLGVSSEMSVSVLVQRAPRVILNSPANGTTFTAPATVNLSATVDQGDAPISKVEFYNGTTKIGEDLTTPYTFNWTNVAAGTYKITARVSDEWGTSTFSPEVTFTVNEAINQPPTVTLTTPANGTSFTAPASISLTATASDVDGTISKVEFYNGTTKLGEDLTAPFEFTWNGVTAGSYILSAKAIDNLGAISSSANASITVNAPQSLVFVSKNSVWKYNDKGVDLGTSWTATNYNDASWSSGGGVLGYGLPVTTTLDFGNDNNKYSSYYFRRSFTVTDASIYATLVFNLRRDDGAVVYLNGVEQFRTNMPGGKISYKTFASSDVTGSEQANYLSFTIPASQLRNGTNVIAVSVHQSDRKSADLCFDMEVLAELKNTNNLVAARVNTNGVYKEIDKSRVLVKALPNPSPSYFTLIMQSGKSETIDIRVYDVTGRVIEARRKLPASGAIKLGNNYRPGTYFAEVIQGSQRTTLKLVKGVD
jgi:hypothetical protein